MSDHWDAALSSSCEVTSTDLCILYNVAATATWTETPGLIAGGLLTCGAVAERRRTHLADPEALWPIACVMPSLEELAQPGELPREIQNTSTCVAVRVNNILTDKSRTIDVSILGMLIQPKKASSRISSYKTHAWNVQVAAMKIAALARTLPNTSVSQDICDDEVRCTTRPLRRTMVNGTHPSLCGMPHLYKALVCLNCFTSKSTLLFCILLHTPP
jgi:hypothetical protein